MNDALPAGTVRLLVRELRGDAPVGQDYIDWAVRALESGLDTQQLRVLAGLDLEAHPSGLEAAERFRAVLQEVRIAIPNRDELLRRHVMDLALEIVRDMREPRDAVEAIHREVLTPFLHPVEFSDWCYLWEGLSPQTFASLDGEALADAIRRTAHKWVEAAQQ